MLAGNYMKIQSPFTIPVPKESYTKEKERMLNINRANNLVIKGASDFHPFHFLTQSSGIRG